MKIQMIIAARIKDCGSPVKVSFLFNSKTYSTEKADRIYWAFFEQNTSFIRAELVNKSCYMYKTCGDVDLDLPTVTYSKRNGLKGDFVVTICPMGVSL